MMAIFLLSNELLITVFIIVCITSTNTITTANAQTIQKSVTLTPSNTDESGASIMAHFDEVSSVVFPIVGINELVWQVDIASQNSWQFILTLDKTWGFSPNTKDTIEIKINSPSIATGSDTFDTLVFGFTADNTNYFSTWLSMDNNGVQNSIYPECDPSATPTQMYGTGDVASLLNTDRDCDIAGGSCVNWRTMWPRNTQYPDVVEYNGFPITYTLENDPINDYLSVSFESASFSSSFSQKCGFVSMATDLGLKVYIGGNDIGQSFIIKSIQVDFARGPSLSPTKSPTKYPTSNPTKIPTINPSLQPSKSPSSFPSKSPTALPSKNPTLTPTTDPTSIPTYNPSSDPSTVPSIAPSESPSPSPSMSPTQAPTFSPIPLPETAFTISSIDSPALAIGAYVVSSCAFCCVIILIARHVCKHRKAQKVSVETEMKHSIDMKVTKDIAIANDEMNKFNDNDREYSRNTKIDIVHNQLSKLPPAPTNSPAIIETNISRPTSHHSHHHSHQFSQHIIMPTMSAEITFECISNRPSFAQTTTTSGTTDTTSPMPKYTQTIPIGAEESSFKDEISDGETEDTIKEMDNNNSNFIFLRPMKHSTISMIDSPPLGNIIEMKPRLLTDVSQVTEFSNIDAMSEHNGNIYKKKPRLSTVTTTNKLPNLSMMESNDTIRTIDTIGEKKPEYRGRENRKSRAPGSNYNEDELSQ